MSLHDSPQRASDGNGFAFAVFGDGPYYPSEMDRFQRVLDEVRASGVEWLIHIGDILWNPCTDRALEERLKALNSIGCPVIYTPGDNEWTDTHDERVGAYDPLERLASIRKIFFCNPGASVGARSIDVVCQSTDGRFREFCENSRWEHRGFVFATMHIVGSNNGRAAFASRSTVHDAEVDRRTHAAEDWLAQAFDHARRVDARGLVLAMHANIGLERDGARGDAFDGIIETLEKNLKTFAHPVLIIHGDTHTHRIDQPFRDRSGRTYANLTRLETFGSPDIGWVRVVLGPDSDSVIEIEPRLMAL